MPRHETCAWGFPSRDQWPVDDDVVAVGADLAPDTLLFAYTHGMFPMHIDRKHETLGWFSPLSRGVIPIDGLHVTKSMRRSARNFNVTSDMAFTDGRLWVAGLSNEEFASKLRALPYPFTAVDAGTSVEIYHGNHQQLETRSPVNAFVPYQIDNKPYLVAGYTCTPLVKFQIGDLKPGQKVRGTTIAEMGAGNRVLDMIVYKKGGQDFLLTANNSRGVMKIPTRDFATASPITKPVLTETGGIAYEKITNLQGVEQLDKLDDQNAIILARAASGAANLQVVALP